MIRRHLRPIPKRKTPWDSTEVQPKGIFLYIPHIRDFYLLE